VAKYLSYTPHSKHQDDYYLDHRHHLSKREDMRALELDPHHFYKVQQEPKHHEHKYFSEQDYDLDSRSSEGEYFEDLIGYHSHQDQDGLTFSSEDDEELNDIQFSINEDVQFKLESEDNYQGRDIDVGIVMPETYPASAYGHPTIQAAPKSIRRSAP